MKRILIALFLVFSLVICLTGCPEKIEEHPEFAKFNEMFANGFENYTITVVTSSYNDDFLNDTYHVTTVDGVTYVTYKVEKLNEFIIEGDTITIPEGYKTVTEGVYNSNTDAEIVDSYKVPAFNFSYACIFNETITDSTFVATIHSLNGFMGLDLEVTDATVRVQFEGTTPTSVVISYYTAEENSVIITYTFN